MSVWGSLLLGCFVTAQPCGVAEVAKTFGASTAKLPGCLARSHSSNFWRHRLRKQASRYLRSWPGGWILIEQ